MPRDDLTALARALAACPDLSLTLDAVTAFGLVAAVQLASRHPTAKFAPAVRDAARVARRVQAELARRLPGDFARLLERGWHEAFDAPNKGGPK